MNPPIIAVDLDGTIADFGNGWQGPCIIDTPLKEPVKALHILMRDKWRIRIHTCRLNRDICPPEFPYKYTLALETLQTWLSENRIPYDDIVEPKEGKPYADVYWDDRGIGFNPKWTAEEIVEQCYRILERNKRL